MTGDLSARQIAALGGGQNSRLVELEQRGDFPDGHDLISALLDRGATDDQAVVGQMLAHRFAYELALGLARRRDRPFQLAPLRSGKANEQRTHIGAHIAKDSI